MKWTDLVVPLIHGIEIILVVAWLTYVYRTLTMDKVTTVNAVSPQPWGIAIVMLGFGMLISCKKWGIDTTIAGGVIGAGVNMLTGKHNDAADLPPGSVLQQTTTTHTPPSPPSSPPDTTPQP